jgi:hypothetical protein
MFWFGSPPPYFSNINRLYVMKTIDKVRIFMFLFLVSIGVMVLIVCEKGHEVFSIPIFSFSLYPLSKIGYGNNIKN